MKNAYTTYRNSSVETADPGRLILIVYDVAIKHCRLALEVIAKNGDLMERNKYLYKAQDAVTELMGSLKLDVGEISINLFRLYEYMGWNLVQAVIKNDPKFIDEALRHLVSLREAWEEAYRNMRITQANTAAGSATEGALATSR